MQELISNPVFVVFCICFLFNIFTFIFIFSRLAFYKNNVHIPAKLPPVSVIITARNEDENLKEFLPYILEQDYPDFEVIVVNDQSEDDTEFVLNDLSKIYPRLKVVTIKDYIHEFPGKKLAIMLGIRKSIYDLLVFTDADCKPAGNQWLKYMVSGFEGNNEIVLGYSPYFRKRSLLNQFIQFDTFYTALQYFSFRLMGKPYMGVGRNMAYRKNLFLENGFSSHLHIPYGDDDLFVNQNATPENVGICLNPGSFMYSKPKENYLKWKRQKTRHLKAGKEYKSIHKLWLGWIWISQAVFYISFIIAAFFFYNNLYFWGFFLFKEIVSLVIYGLVLKKFNQKRLIWYVLFLDIVYQLLLLPELSFSAMTSRRNVW